MGMLGGDSEDKTTINSTPPPGPDEQELTKLNIQLAQKQLENLNNLQPFQQQLLESSMAELKRQNALNSAFDSAVTPEQQAAAAKADFERSQKMGPIQDELLQLQLAQLRSGGAATPEQLARIKDAADKGIEAGSADIDLSTKRGIGLIADELANSRGLRLSDSPIGSEAALLARGGEDQKASLIKNLRAGQATAALNYPLAANQLMSGINLSQQNVATAAQQFQAQLRQQAAANRMAMFGTSSNSGLGLATIGNGVGTGTLSTLTGNRNVNVGQDQGTDRMKVGIGTSFLFGGGG